MLKPATPKLFFSLLLLYQLVTQSAVDAKISILSDIVKLKNFITFSKVKSL